MRPRISDIITIAARLSGTSAEDITSQRRYLHLCAIRSAIYSTARDWGYSLPEIGRAVGGRDHSTVINGIVHRERVSSYIPEFDDFLSDVERWADELPPFVEEANWQPDRTYAVRLTYEAQAEIRRRESRKTSRDLHARRMARGSDALLDALRGAVA